MGKFILPCKPYLRCIYMWLYAVCLPIKNMVYLTEIKSLTKQRNTCLCEKVIEKIPHRFGREQAALGQECWSSI